MTQAERYQAMVDKREGHALDSSYKAAMYILSTEEALTAKALPHIDHEGIFFEAIFENAYLYGQERTLLEVAYSLFNWDTDSPPSPHDIAMLGYPYLDVVVQAMYIASGVHDVKVESKADGPNLVIDPGKYKQAKAFHAMLGQLAGR